MMRGLTYPLTDLEPTYGDSADPDGPWLCFPRGCHCGLLFILVLSLWSAHTIGDRLVDAPCCPSCACPTVAAS